LPDLFLPLRFIPEGLFPATLHPISPHFCRV
jgi:hypothetical protein